MVMLEVVRVRSSLVWRRSSSAKLDGTIDLFLWKLTSVLVGSVIYFVIRAVVLRMGMDANDMKLLSAVIVALALCVPVALAKYRLRKDYSEGGEE